MAPVVPYLSYRDTAAALTFLTQAFGVTVTARWDDDGVVQHAEVVLGDGVVMLGTADHPPTSVTDRSVGQGVSTWWSTTSRPRSTGRWRPARPSCSPLKTPSGARSGPASSTRRDTSGASGPTARAVRPVDHSKHTSRMSAPAWSL